MKDKLNSLVNRIALYIYLKMNELTINKSLFSKGSRVEHEISLTNPGIRTDGLVRDYYVKKIGLTIYVAIAGILIILMMIISEATGGYIDDDFSIERNEFGKGSVNYEVIPENDNYDYGVINVEVDEKMPGDAEISKILEEFQAELEGIILNDNSSFEHIDNDMNLVSSVDGYPFYIRWESGNYEVIDEKGALLSNAYDDNGVSTTIKANISYLSIKREIIYYITVYPRKLSDNEAMLMEMTKAIQESNADNTDKERLYLPLEIQGTRINWKEKREHKALVLMVLVIVMIVAVWHGKDQDLHTQYEKRNRELLDEYADIVCELEMYLSAGLTIRGAVERVNRSYLKSINSIGQHKAAYEELAVCVKRLNDGNNESDCYEQWGIRCGLLNYKKLSSLLIQNLRKGTDGLIEALANETRIAFEERKALIKKKGEEAQTRLLFPMMLMLGVVMIIIMIPAYMSFGI